MEEKIDGSQLRHPHFADDIVPMTSKTTEVKGILGDLDEACDKTYLDCEDNKDSEFAPELSRKKRAAWEFLQENRGCVDENKDNPASCPPFDSMILYASNYASET
ncbi:unnamed protein product [Angiostrongylus costaricensis]|uniref:S ribonuclease n=1 Tax=Angiostrongylus costaricensis TaxID=334426 RepID=A0A0R3Q2A4_ANGCS|nr:unnamed protein product [Angiostrongylus costaricensis]